MGKYSKVNDVHGYFLRSSNETYVMVDNGRDGYSSYTYDFNNLKVENCYQDFGLYHDIEEHGCRKYDLDPKTSTIKSFDQTWIPFIEPFCDPTMKKARVTRDDKKMWEHAIDGKTGSIEKRMNKKYAVLYKKGEKKPRIVQNIDEGSFIEFNSWSEIPQKVMT